MFFFFFTLKTVVRFYKVELVVLFLSYKIYNNTFNVVEHCKFKFTKTHLILLNLILQ